MIEIKNNRYYKRKLITEGMSVYPRFKDFSKKTDDLYYLNGGFNATQIVLSGSVPAAPTVGGGELETAYLRTYCTGMNLSGAVSLPEQEVYLLQSNIAGQEGGFEIGTYTEDSNSLDILTGSTYDLGDKLAVYSAYLDPEIPWMVENFDGSNKSFGTALIQDNDRAASSLKDLYISPEDGEAIIWAGGDAFFGGGASDDVSHNLKKYFSNPENQRCYVKPLKKNNIRGLWTAAYDNRNEKQKWQIYAPYWKWKQLQTKIQVGSPLPPTQGANTKEMPDVSTNNTIFNDIFATAPLGNVLTVDSSSNPIFSSDIEINGEKKKSGGSSLKCHHLSTFTSSTKFMSNMEGSLGKRKYNPQTIRAGMWNIPKPLPLDAGGFGYAWASGNKVLSGSISGSLATADTEIAFGAHLADKRMSLPEINITMNIEKLYPSPAINTDRWNESGTIYYRTIGVGDGTLSDTDPTYESLQVNGEVADDSDVFVDSRGSLRTFWRSVVITWSSYKANGFNTLDDFLHYGMDQFYTTGNNNIQLCGMVFERFHGNAEWNLSGASGTPDTNAANIGNIYAYALPVTAWGSPTASDQGLYASGGMASLPGKPASSGRVMIHDPRILTEPTTATEPHWVELPEDGWINMKVVFDVNQPWGKKTYSKEAAPFEYNLLHNPAPETYTGDREYASNIAYGTPAMAFFDGCISGSNAGSDQLTGSLDDNKPFVVMPFMVRDNDNNTTASFTNTTEHGYDGCQTFQDGANIDTLLEYASGSFYNGVACPWKQSPWTPHMTIWVNNYRWTQYNNSSSSPDYIFQGITGSINAGAFDDFRGADSKLYESGSGSPETLVYFDDIEFKYFNNIITNHSATAGKIQQFVNFKNPLIKSPFMTRFSGSDDTPSEANLLRDMNRDGTLYPRRTGHGIAIGYDKFDQMVNSVGATLLGTYDQDLTVDTNKYGYVGYAYQIWNNFSTSSFDNLRRITPAAAWVTVGNWPSGNTSVQTNSAKGTGQGGWNKMGHQCWGSQWGNNGLSGVDCKINSAYSSPVGTAGDTTYVSNFTLNCNIYQTGWQGLGMWYGGASGATLASGGADFHGASGASDAWHNNTLYQGRAWMHVCAGTLGGTKVTISGDDYNNPNNSNRKYGGHYYYVGQGDSGEGFGSTDGFTQKGLTMMAIDRTYGENTPTLAGARAFNTSVDGTTINAQWMKRENIWASAKILAVPGQPGLNMADDEAEMDGNSIIVDNPGILLPEQEDCEYVIYRAGAGKDINGDEAIWNGTVDTGHASDEAIVSNTVLKICKLAMTRNNSQGTEGAIFFDQSTTDLAAYPLSELWISPYKFWVNLEFVSTGNGAYDGTKFIASEHAAEVAPLNFPRSYESIMQINQRFTGGGGGESTFGDVVGSTYNESVYNYDDSQSTAGVRALYTKPWILEAGSKATSLVVDQDFGFGTYDEEQNEGGQLGRAAVVLDTHNDIDLKGLVETAGVAPSEDINLVLGLSNQVANKSIELVGDENTASLDEAFLPSMVWQYHDELPSVTQFRVKAAFDALEKDVNLYELTKENVNNIMFTWDEEAEDVWYRMLMVDSKNIPDKYANAFFWAPLNASSSTIGAKPTLEEYDMTVTPRQYPDNGTALTVGPDVRSKIDGLAGYAAYTTTGADGFISGTAQMKDLEEYTFVMHLTPSSADTGTTVWVAAEGDPATTGFGILLTGGYVKAYTAGDTATSTTLLPCDGETPVSIIVTYQSGSTIGPDFKLYINGALEDYILSPGPSTATDELVLGGLYDGSAGTYEGSMEEVIIYDKALTIVESEGEYLYDPSELTEVSSNKYVTQHARLFIMDYHNIRGLNRDTVAASNQISWKVTTL